MIKKNKIVSKIILIPMLLLFFGILGYMLLAGVYCLPTDRMEKNMQEKSFMMC